MKTSKLMASLLLLCVAVSAWAKTWSPESLDKENGVYLIKTLDDWNHLADYVAASVDNTCAGMSFKMTEDIGSAQNPVTKTMGCQIGNDKNKHRRRFAGSFDGDGHTLYVAITTPKNNPGYAAPFSYVKNFVVKNLHVEGTVTTSGQWGSGLVGSSGTNEGNADGVITIENCHVSVAITSQYKSGNAYANHAGILAIAENDATIKDCWFDGQFLTEGEGDFKHSGGFIALNKGKATLLTNCLFAPSNCSMAEDKYKDAAQFVHMTDLTKYAVSENSTMYYKTQFGTVEQGLKLEETVPSGKIFYPMQALDAKDYYAVLGEAKEATVAGQKRYWATIYEANNSYKLPAGVQALTLDSEKKLVVVGDGSVIPAGTAVIIMSTIPTMELAIVKTEPTKMKLENILQGSELETTIPASGTVYVMEIKNGKLGFIKYSGKKLPANRAYYVQ